MSPRTEESAPDTTLQGAATGRPIAVAVAVTATAVLAALTVIGALVFNLVGADSVSTVVKGGLLMLWAIGYLIAAVGLVRRRRNARLLLAALLPFHFALNVGKVAGGETFSVLFLVLIALIAFTLTTPSTCKWLRRRIPLNEGHGPRSMAS